MCELKLGNSWINSKPLIIVVKPQSQTVVLKQIAFPESLPKLIDGHSLESFVLVF